MNMPDVRFEDSLDVSDEAIAKVPVFFFPQQLYNTISHDPTEVVQLMCSNLILLLYKIRVEQSNLIVLKVSFLIHLSPNEILKENFENPIVLARSKK